MVFAPEWLLATVGLLLTPAVKKGEKSCQHKLLYLSKRQPYFIRQQEDFARLFCHGKVIRGGLWQLRVMPNSSSKQARLGVIISKRNVASAVLRNRLRRIVREHFRQNLLGQLPAVDLLLQLRQKMSSPINNHECVVAMQSLFCKI